MTLRRILEALTLATLAVAFPCGARAQDHAELMSRYAIATTAALFAEDACPGLRVNQEQLARLRLRAQITSGDEPALARKIRTNSKSVKAAFAHNGQEAWCARAYGFYGAAGTIAPGVLER